MVNRTPLVFSKKWALEHELTEEEETALYEGRDYVLEIQHECSKLRDYVATLNKEIETAVGLNEKAVKGILLDFTEDILEGCDKIIGV